MEFDAENTDCRVRTYVQGALSAMGHDLELRVGRLRIEVDDASGAIRATFDPSSLQVVGAMKGGARDPGALGAADRRKIEANIRKDVLHPSKHPEIRFESSSVDAGSGVHHVRGELTLHGTTRTVAFDVIEHPDRYEARVPLHQPDFGIRPYKAPLGVLKVKPEVLVLVTARR